MKKWKTIHAGFFACLFLLLVGCGVPKVPDVVKENSLSISDKGEVVSYLVDEFDKQYYSITDLTAMAMGEAADYNREHADGEANPVVVENVEMPDENSNMVLLTQRFINAGTYADYNGEILFYGTISDALKAGYEFADGWKDVKSGSTVSRTEILQKGDTKVIVTDVKAVIYPPSRVWAISDGTYNDNGTVNTVGTDGTVMIVLK